MPETSRLNIDHDRGISRRALVKGGLSVAAGAVATVLAARAGSAAVTPMDVARTQTSPAVTPVPATTPATTTATTTTAPASTGAVWGSGTGTTRTTTTSTTTTGTATPSFWFSSQSTKP